MDIYIELEERIKHKKDALQLQVTVHSDMRNAHNISIPLSVHCKKNQLSVIVIVQRKIDFGL